MAEVRSDKAKEAGLGEPALFVFSAKVDGLGRGLIGKGVSFFEVPVCVPVPSFFRAYSSGLASGLVRFPVVGSKSERAFGVGLMRWLAYSDEELVHLSFGDEKLFKILCGFERALEISSGGYVDGNGFFDSRLYGWKRMRSRVAEMREKWVEEWLTRTGLKLSSGDGLATRFFNGELLSGYGRALTEARVNFDSEPRLDGKLDSKVEAQLVYPVLGSFPVKSVELGEDLSAAFTGELRRLLDGGSRQSLAFRFSPSVYVWLQRMGRTLLPWVMKPGGKSGEEKGQGMLMDFPELEVFQRYFYKAVGVYLDERLGKDTFGRGPAEEGFFGAGEVRVFGTGKEVQVPGLAMGSLSGLPVGYAEKIVVWGDRVREAFYELGGIASMGEVGTLSEANRDIFKAVGFEFGRTSEGPVFRATMSSSAVGDVAYRLSRGVAVGVGSTARTKGAALMVSLLRQYLLASGLTSRFLLEWRVDLEFERRVSVVGEAGCFWDEVEGKATEVLGKSLAMGLVGKGGGISKPLPLEWGYTGDRRSFIGRWNQKPFSKVMTGTVPERDTWDWFRVLGDQWARGVVLLEGSMRAYLRHVGCLLEGPEGTTTFWRELGVKGSLGTVPKTVPPWRWLVLREAYLAAYVWAWGQLLHGGWVPFDKASTRRFRLVLASYSSMFGAVSRRSVVPSSLESGNPTDVTYIPYWDGEPIDVKGPGVSFYAAFGGMGFDRHMTDFYSSDRVGFSYGGRDYVAMGAKDEIIPVIGVADEPQERGSFALVGEDVEAGVSGKWVADTEDGFDNPGSRLVGIRVGDETMGSAAQTVGLWFAAGQSRYATMKYGRRFALWARENKLSVDGLPAWVPFGLLSMKEWDSTEGSAGLFDDPVRLDLGQRMDKVPEFAAWSGLGQRMLPAWSATERAPMSFPMSQASVAKRFGMSEMSHYFGSTFWFDRVIRCLGRGLDPTLCLPLSKTDYAGMSREDSVGLARWRETIWRPVLGDVGFHHSVPWERKEEVVPVDGLLSKPVLGLWKNWMRPWVKGGLKSSD